MSDAWYPIAVAVGLAISVLVGRIVVMATLKLAARTPGEHDDEPRGSERANGPTGINATRALRGGTWIGNLERLAVTGAIIFGYPEAIAIVVAVKGLGRFPELRGNPDASERFVIGTLASYLWAAAIGIGVLALR